MARFTGGVPVALSSRRRRLGDAFDAETKAAWVAVYGIVQKTMIGDNYN